MLEEDRLDLGRVDVHPAADDHVDLAIADVVVALVVAVGDVADAEETVVVAGGGGVGTVEVLGERVVADLELARRSDRDLDAPLVDQADLLARHRGARRARLAELVLGPKDGVDAGLGRAVELPEDGTEVGDAPLLEADRAGRRARDQLAKGGVIDRGPHVLREVHHPRDQRRRHEGGRDPVSGDQGQSFVGVEALLDHDRGSEELAQRGEEADGAVIAGPCHQVDVVGPQLEDPDRLQDVLEVDPIGAIGALRSARGAGGVDHAGADRDGTVGGLVGAALREQLLIGEPARGRRRGAGDEIMPRPLDQRASLLHHRQEFGAGGDHPGARVVDDVRDLRRLQVVVDRDPDRSDPTGSMGRLGALDRVVGDARDAVTRSDPEAPDRGRVPVRPLVQLGEGYDAIFVVEGRLAALRRRVGGEGIGHRRGAVDTRPAGGWNERWRSR